MSEQVEIVAEKKEDEKHDQYHWISQLLLGLFNTHLEDLRH